MARRLAESREPFGDFKKPLSTDMSNIAHALPPLPLPVSKASSRSKVGDGNNNENSDASFFDMLTRVQANRLEDQRCELKTSANKPSKAPPSAPQVKCTSSSSSSSSSSSKKEDAKLIDLLAKTQCARLDDQRSSHVRHVAKTHALRHQQQQQLVVSTVPPNDEFMMLIQKVQSRRLDEQRAIIQKSSKKESPPPPPPPSTMIGKQTNKPPSQQQVYL